MVDSIRLDSTRAILVRTCGDSELDLAVLTLIDRRMEQWGPRAQLRELYLKFAVLDLGSY
jgi:hypothetical protein